MLHHEQRKGSVEPFLFCCNICWARTREGASVAKGAGDALSSERSEAVHIRRRGRRLQAPALQPVEPPMLHRNFDRITVDFFYAQKPLEIRLSAVQAHKRTPLQSDSAAGFCAF